MLNHLSLFSGIGGDSLAAEWAGFQTVAFCEIDKYCQKVLAKHWPKVPIYDDIRTITTQFLANRNITLISGGFPCQPFSDAGEQRGKEDDRYLWPHMLEVIKHYNPSWVLAENVNGVIGLALDDVLLDLEKANYETGTVVLPACSVGAWHVRERVFIIAHSNSQPTRGLQIGAQPQNPGITRSNQYDVWDKWATRPDYGGMAYGVPRRLDRLRTLGNAIVPAQIYPILKAIADYELSQQ